MKVADRKLFFRLVKMGFGQRRKVFTNAMKSGGISMELGKKILEREGLTAAAGEKRFRWRNMLLLPMHGMNWW